MSTSSPLAAHLPGAFPFGLRELSRVIQDVHAADLVMEEIVRDIDEIAFQTDVLALQGRAAAEVSALRLQAAELRDFAGKLGSLVGFLAEAELAERRRRLGPGRKRGSLSRHLAIPPSGAATLGKRPPARRLSSFVSGHLEVK